MKYARLLLMCLFSTLIISGCGIDVIPEMKECMQAHGSLEKYRTVIKKYASPQMQQKLPVCCTLLDSRIIASETKDGIVYYWEEGRIIESSYELPSETIQVIKVGWKDKKIVFLEFLGPMELHEKKYIKSEKAKAEEVKITR
ncbi:MAG TPA: hypothetical protein PK358_00080 [Spirochaetota bacterium]|nr:hypothetical protein [Spirochaetota bacterium]HPJ33198.1 hypothetical protein [Spirochaetota bacterium]